MWSSIQPWCQKSLIPWLLTPVGMKTSQSWHGRSWQLPLSPGRAGPGSFTLLGGGGLHEWGFAVIPSHFEPEMLSLLPPPRDTRGCCSWIKEAAAPRLFSKANTTFDLSEELILPGCKASSSTRLLMPPPSHSHCSLLGEKPIFCTENPSPFDVFPILCYLSPWAKLTLGITPLHMAVSVCPWG